jgi:hypothetical protein
MYLLGIWFTVSLPSPEDIFRFAFHLWTNNLAKRLAAENTKVMVLPALAYPVLSLESTIATWLWKVFLSHCLDTRRWCTDVLTGSDTSAHLLSLLLNFVWTLQFKSHELSHMNNLSLGARKITDIVWDSTVTPGLGTSPSCTPKKRTCAHCLGLLQLNCLALVLFISRPPNRVRKLLCNLRNFN